MRCLCILLTWLELTVWRYVLVMSGCLFLWMPSHVFAQYNDIAGENDVNAEVFSDPVVRDAHGNLKGSAYDLVMDGTFDGQLIVIVNLCGEELKLGKLEQVLKRKGFSTLVLDEKTGATTLQQHLKRANQLWVISDYVKRLNEGHYKVIRSFFEQGHGVYLVGDNAPYFADVNAIAARLFPGAYLHGDLPGEQVVHLKEKGSKSGVIKDHLLSTGLTSVYEGVTISTVEPGKMMTPFFWGSSGDVVAAYYDQKKQRAVLDGGFTRLMPDLLVRAGTTRYVVNVAAWLANIERFGDAVIAPERRKSFKITGKVARTEFGELVPGSSKQQKIYLNGDFKNVAIRLSLDARRPLPSCIRVEVNGKALPDVKTLSAGQSLHVKLVADAYCGQRIEREFVSAIRLEAKDATSRKWSVVGSLEFAVYLKAWIKVRLSALPVIEVGQGGKLYYAHVTSNSKESFELKALMELAEASEDDVFYRLFAGKERTWSKGVRALAFDVPVGKKGAKVPVAFKASSCCVVGKYPATFKFFSRRGEVVEYPFAISVRGEDFLGCWGERMAWMLGVLLVLLIVGYVVSIWRHSHFLRQRHVVAALIPLRWDEWGEPSTQESQVVEVRRLVSRGMGLGARLWAFFKANPLKVGWYKGAYYETIQLYLEPSRDITRSRVMLLSERDFLGGLRSQPQLGVGKVFMTARGGLTAFAIPDASGRVGRLEYYDNYGVWKPMMEGDEITYEIITLRKANLLDIASDREVDMGAGWRVG